MEFLREYLSEETYNALVKELEGKDIKLGNLANGEYVSRGKYDRQNKEFSEAQSLIEQLKNENANNQGLQDKIRSYESQIAELTEKAKKAELENAVKVKLLAAKAKAEDIDYIMYKMNQNNPDLSIGENGEVKGLDSIIDGLKTTYPNNFESKETKKIEVNTLPRGEENKLSKEEFSKMKYNERNALYNENPELYRELSQN